MREVKYLVLFMFSSIAMFVFTSCEKYLNVKSDARLVVPNDLESLQQILDASQNMNFNLCSYGEVAADDYFLLQNTYNGLNDEQKLAYIWENYVYNFNNDWARAYYTVYNANLVLDRLIKIRRTEDNRFLYDRVKGAAHYYRAMQYLSLLWTYAHAYDPSSAVADLGIVLRTSADFNDISVRSTVQESYAAVLNDLTISGELLPATVEHVMRPSKSAVYGSLARTHLSMGQYDSAYYYADVVLKTNNALLDLNDTKDVDASNSYPFSRFNRETLFYAELTNSNVQISERNLRADTNLYNSYMDDDWRKELFFRLNADGYQAYRGSYSNSNRMFGGITVGEMYLIRAEGAARTGRLSESIRDLNTLLEHRIRKGKFVPVQAATVEEAVALVIRERRKELLFRGLRWIDVKRLNLTDKKILLKRVVSGKQYLLEPGDNRFALPIPDDVIRISGIQQNPI